MLKNLALALGLLITSCGYAETSQKKSIFPPNDMRIPVRAQESMGGGLTEKQFNDVIDVAQAILEPWAKANNEKLVIDRDWTNDEVNAAMMRSGGTLYIYMYGGLSRHNLIKPESFALVLAHEASHGYCWKFTDSSRKTVYIREAQKICSESNADTQGNGDINPLFIKGLMDKGYQFELTSDPYLDNKCADKWDRDSVDYKLCVIRLNAGQHLGSLLAELMNEPEPSYAKRDPTVVTRTNASYPKYTQCRLDSYFDGVFHLPYSKCWYKP